MNIALYESRKIVAVANEEGWENPNQHYREITPKEMKDLKQQGVRQAEIRIPAIFPDLEDLAYGPASY